MKLIIEYIWLGGKNELRSKTRVLDDSIIKLNSQSSRERTESLLLKKDNEPDVYVHVPHWNYDGSSTEQASGHDSEVILIPVAIYRDPFIGGNHALLVLCETQRPDGTPLENNHRPWAKQIFDKHLDQEPWYGIEQEYFLTRVDTDLPVAFPKNKSHQLAPQGQYYCSVGTGNVWYREIAQEHLYLCIKAGLTISGMNAEVAPSQWEYQIGPCVGIHSGDEMWVSRYLLERIAEKYGVAVNWEPKPLSGDWNGSGCHTNFSTQSMREGTEEKTGLEYIEEAIEKLKKNHGEHMAIYGTGNEKRMTGKHETADFYTCTSGVANRGASIRIGNETYQNKKGYFEDRRPSSNMNPYLVTGKLMETTG